MKPDKIYLSLALLIIFTIFLWITSCTHVANIDSFPEVCFESDVLPIFTNNCAMTGCHDGGSGEGRPLNNYVDISHTVVPYNPNASSSYQAIIAKWGDRMPPSQALSQENRTKIRLWIEQGALLTTCSGVTGNDPGSGGGAVVKRACFNRDILPVLNSRCAVSLCHDAITHKEGYVFSSYSSSIRAVSAGSPAKSKLYQSITLTSGEGKMPPSGSIQLSRAEIDSIGKWIGYGALNETCGDVCDTISPVTYSATIWPIMQTSCTGCHAGSSPGGGILLTNYNQVKAAAVNGSLMNSLNGNGVTKMPQGSSFTSCRIRQFDIWVKSGSLNN
jgi:hypothetical protein